MRTPLAVAACTLALVGCQAEPAAESEPVAPVVQFHRASADRAAHGKRIADVLGCTGCHGENLTGEDWSEPGFGRLWTANLTRAVGPYSDAQLEQIIRSGRRPDGAELWEMPSHLFTHIAAEDMGALIFFLRTVKPAGEVRPAPLFEEGTEREIAAGTFKSSNVQVKETGQTWPPDVGRQHALGRYIVRATCAECHGLDLRGGKPYATAAERPDLRMVAAYDLEPFRRLLRTGIAAGERELGLMSEVARGRDKHLTDQEVEAVHTYLQAVGKAE